MAYLWMNIYPVSAMLHEYIWILSCDECFMPKHILVPWLWRRSWDWKGFQSNMYINWLVLNCILFLHNSWNFLKSNGFYFFKDCSRKETEYSTNATIFKEKYQNVCKQMGVHVSTWIITENLSLNLLINFQIYYWKI